MGKWAINVMTNKMCWTYPQKTSHFNMDMLLSTVHVCKELANKTQLVADVCYVADKKCKAFKVH